MSRSLNTINAIQGVSANNNRGRRGKNKSVTTQSHNHVAELETKLAIEKAVGRERRKAYRETLKAVREVQAESNKTIETVCATFGQSMTEVVQSMGRNYATVDGCDRDKVAENDRETVKRANDREVARNLHDPEVYTVKESAADSTVPVKAEKKAETVKTEKKAEKKTVKTEKKVEKKAETVKKAEKKAETVKKAEKKAEKAEKVVNDDAIKALNDLYNAGLITECAYNRALKKAETVKAEKAETVKTEKKAEKAEKRTYGKKGGYRRPVRKVDMTNIREVLAKNGVIYNVGEFVHTQTGEKLYGVWMTEKTDDGVAWLKDTFGVYYSKFALAFVFNYKPDTALKSGKAKKTA